ncbi:MAG: hypothetical protein U9N42_05045 [Campylobacterota bacterium]|nr:hypothetical protein [Campylobacterota bacterium]
MDISSNISSIGANQTFLNNGANNVANSNTDGFIPTETTISETVPNSSVQANSTLATDTGSTKSQTNLASEITNQIVNENVTGVNVAAIKTQDQVMGTLLDMRA